jgi:hypothetical protein
VLEVLAHQRALARDPPAHVRDHLLGLGAQSSGPARAPALAEAVEARQPITQPRHRDDGGVVRPVLEELAVPLEELLEHGGAVVVEATEQDVVVGALDDVDRVHLHEPHALDLTVDGGRRRAASRIRQQSLRLQQQSSSRRRWNDGEGRGGGAHGQRVSESARE